MTELADEVRHLRQVEEWERMLDEGLAELRRMARGADQQGHSIPAEYQREAIRQLFEVQSKLVELSFRGLEWAAACAFKGSTAGDEPADVRAREDARKLLVERGLVVPSEFDALTEDQLLALVNRRIDDAWS